MVDGSTNTPITSQSGTAQGVTWPASDAHNKAAPASSPTATPDAAHTGQKQSKPGAPPPNEDTAPTTNTSAPNGRPSSPKAPSHAHDAANPSHQQTNGTSDTTTPTAPNTTAPNTQPATDQQAAAKHTHNHTLPPERDNEVATTHRAPHQQTNPHSPRGVSPTRTRR